MKIGIKQAAQIIKSIDNVGILAHKNPDGDCIGGAYALCLILRRMNRRARVLCSDALSEKLGRCFCKYDTDTDFVIDTYISVDVATEALLGSYSDLAGKVLLCIDHHPTNSLYAKNTLVDDTAGAACELVYLLARELNVPMDADIATALYIGIMTDTGCFQYQNVSPRTHRIAADLLEVGVPAAALNREFMTLKSRGRLALERLAVKGLRYGSSGRVAIMSITKRMRTAAHVTEEELDGVAPIPCQIEGVEIGVTVREIDNRDWRVSIRTATVADASAIAARFGGGGHKRAAGCTLSGSLDDVIEKIAAVCESEIESITK